MSANQKRVDETISTVTGVLFLLAVTAEFSGRV
jgi:hypothetical protein